MRGCLTRRLVEQAKRRSFTAEYKARILAEADACTRPGEVGELLRREGLYTSHLTYWRKQRKDGALKDLGQPRGRRPADKRDAQIVALTRRDATGRPHRFSAAKKALTSTRNYNDDSPATSVRLQRSPNAGNGIAPAARV